MGGTGIDTKIQKKKKKDTLLPMLGLEILGSDKLILNIKKIKSQSLHHMLHY